jgi:hypothetical protein
MRYAKDSLVVSFERDIPLLRQVRNSKFVSHVQLFEFMRLGGFERSRNSFNWRIKRLIDCGHIAICTGVFGAGSSVYRITRVGLTLLEYHGQFTTVLHSNTQHLPNSSQVFHALELNTIQLALARKNLLAGWQSELEIASFNTISRTPYCKDFDAIVDVWIDERRARFALEYERTLKGERHYQRIRSVLESEEQIPTILYLSSGPEVLVHLVHEFDGTRKPLAFCHASSFENELLDTTVITGEGRPAIRFRSLLGQYASWSLKAQVPHV